MTTQSSGEGGEATPETLSSEGPETSEKA
jgi:hypothetical protein